LGFSLFGVWLAAVARSPDFDLVNKYQGGGSGAQTKGKQVVLVTILAWIASTPDFAYLVVARGVDGNECASPLGVIDLGLQHDPATVLGPANITKVVAIQLLTLAGGGVNCNRRSRRSIRDIF
jgi:hypothetical protein